MDTETTENIEQTENNDSTVEQTTDNSAENTAYKELYEAQQKELKSMQKEITELKVSNAKLAIQQSASTPQQTCEELLNKMF